MRMIPVGRRAHALFCGIVVLSKFVKMAKGVIGGLLGMVAVRGETQRIVVWVRSITIVEPWPVAQLGSFSAWGKAIKARKGDS